MTSAACCWSFCLPSFTLIAADRGKELQDCNVQTSRITPCCLNNCSLSTSNILRGNTHCSWQWKQSVFSRLLQSPACSFQSMSAFFCSPTTIAINWHCNFCATLVLQKAGFMPIGPFTVTQVHLNCICSMYGHAIASKADIVTRTTHTTVTSPLFCNCVENGHCNKVHTPVPATVRRVSPNTRWSEENVPVCERQIKRTWLLMLSESQVQTPAAGKHVGAVLVLVGSGRKPGS